MAKEKAGKKIEVVALKTGYYGHGRRREGVVFFMDENDMKKDKDGKRILPSWVELKSLHKSKAAKEAEEKAEVDPVFSPDPAVDEDSVI